VVVPYPIQPSPLAGDLREVEAFDLLKSIRDMLAASARSARCGVVALLGWWYIGGWAGCFQVWAL